MRSQLTIALLFAFAFAAPTSAQTISSCAPRSMRVGESTRLHITGTALQDSYRVVTTHGFEWEIESTQADQLVVNASLPDEVPLGPVGFWVVTKSGVSGMFLVIVDDLPGVTEANDNHSVDKAQVIDAHVALFGRSDGSKSDFYRFHADEGQRVAIEVLTQDLRSTMDPVVRLLRADGTQIRVVDDDEVGPDCRLSQTLKAAGEYLLEIRDSRYNAGGEYYLRVGDFPLIRHCVPLAIQRDVSTRLRFATADQSTAEPTEVLRQSRSTRSVEHVSSRNRDGKSSSWSRVLVSHDPQVSESELNTALKLPIGINGELSAASEKDTFTIQGQAGETFRFFGRTRSLGSYARLKMQLAKADGAIVAQTPVNDSDEWSFDFKFPDDGMYQLTATDLLGRGGVCFGYHIEISRPTGFQLALKPDAKSREQFAIEVGEGACSVDLQINRSGYEGVIDLSVDDPRIQILNPTIPAKAKAATIYLTAGPEWNASSSAHIRITGVAKEDPNPAATVSSVSLHRTKRPHVMFPHAFDDRVLMLGGAEAGSDHFTLEPKARVQLARQTKSHQASLTLNRVNKEFKAGVTVLPHRLPDSWTVSAKANKDQYVVTWTRGNTDSQPEIIPLLVYSEFQGKGRLTSTKVPLQWIDPISMSISHSDPLIAGQKTILKAIIKRAGNDIQPATLKFTGLPDGWSSPDSVSIAADADEISFELQVADTASGAAVLNYELSGEYQGTDYVIPGSWRVPSIIPLPDELRYIRRHWCLTARAIGDN